LRRASRHGGARPAKPTRALDLTRTYLHFTPSHEIERHQAGAKFWAELMSERLRLDGRLVGCARLKKGALDHWERHPAGDEFLMLLSGAMSLVLEQPDGGVTRSRMKKGQACIVPRGLWHTFVVTQAGELMFATAGEGTTHRRVIGGKARGKATSR
jgi:oxalate decarboxylase/phosphoglucose isomerase-like protein (cupin superfamily)